MTKLYIISTNNMDFDSLNRAVEIARMMNVECDIIETWHDDFTGKHGRNVVATFRHAGA